MAANAVFNFKKVSILGNQPQNPHFPSLKEEKNCSTLCLIDFFRPHWKSNFFTCLRIFSSWFCIIFYFLGLENTSAMSARCHTKKSFDFFKSKNLTVEIIQFFKKLYFLILNSMTLKKFGVRIIDFEIIDDLWKISNWSLNFFFRMM